MAVVKISVIFTFTLFSYFSYSSKLCSEGFDNSDTEELNSDVLNTAHKVLTRELSNEEEQTLLRLYNFIQEQSEPLTPKQIFDNVAFDLEQAGFNLYELWSIAHSNTLKMSNVDKRNFKKLLKGKFSDNELGLPVIRRYPKELKVVGLMNPNVNHGSIVHTYHHPHSYKNHNDTYLNNSHYILARFNPFSRGHQIVFGWVDLKDTQYIQKVKDPMNRYVTGKPFAGIKEWEKAFAVYFLYEGQMIKEYLPFYAKTSRHNHLEFLMGNIMVQATEGIIPKTRKNIGLLRYSLQRLKVRDTQNAT